MYQKQHPLIMQVYSTLFIKKISCNASLLHLHLKVLQRWNNWTLAFFYHLHPIPSHPILTVERICWTNLMEWVVVPLWVAFQHWHYTRGDEEAEVGGNPTLREKSSDGIKVTCRALGRQRNPLKCLDDMEVPNSTRRPSRTEPHRNRYLQECLDAFDMFLNELVVITKENEVYLFFGEKKYSNFTHVKI